LVERGIPSDLIAKLSRDSLGIPTSTKTVIRRAKLAGVYVRQKGKWVKKRGPAAEPYTTKNTNRWTSPLPEPEGWGVVRNRLRKTRIPGPALVNIAQAFCAWWSYASSGGFFDFEAVADGEKPP